MSSWIWRTYRSVLVAKLPTVWRAVHIIFVISSSFSFSFALLFGNHIPRNLGIPSDSRRCIRVTIWSIDLKICENSFERTNPLVTAFRWISNRKRVIIRTTMIFSDWSKETLHLRAPCCELLLNLMSAESVILVCSGKSVQIDVRKSPSESFLIQFNGVSYRLR